MELGIAIAVFAIITLWAALESGILDFNFSKPSTGILIVGMGNSRRYGKCDGALHDAETMKKILDDYGKPTILTDANATKANVVNALNSLKNKELLIFFYSGHGGSDKIGDVSDEPDKKNEYLCLHDTYLLDNEIWNIIQTAKGRVFLIFDCCHSETMFRSPGVDIGNVIVRSPWPRASHIKMLCWSGCADNTYSYGGASGGQLTNAIYRAFGKRKSYEKVWKLVQKRMPANQVPKITEIGGSFAKKRIFC